MSLLDTLVEEAQKLTSATQSIGVGAVSIAQSVGKTFGNASAAVTNVPRSFGTAAGGSLAPAAAAVQTQKNFGAAAPATVLEDAGSPTGIILIVVIAIVAFLFLRK